MAHPLGIKRPPRFDFSHNYLHFYIFRIHRFLTGFILSLYIKKTPLLKGPDERQIQAVVSYHFPHNFSYVIRGYSCLPSAPAPGAR